MQKQCKPKLPRKRKKAAIKAQGRKWYRNTITLWLVCRDNELLSEKKCKFWVNDSVIQVSSITPNGCLVATLVPTKYW